MIGVANYFSKSPYNFSIVSTSKRIPKIALNIVYQIHQTENCISFAPMLMYKIIRIFIKRSK